MQPGLKTFPWLGVILLSLSCATLSSRQPATPAQPTVPVTPVVEAAPTLTAPALPTTGDGTPDVSGTVMYQVEHIVTIENTGQSVLNQIDLVVAHIRDLPPYQDVLSFQVSPDADGQFSDMYGNAYLEFVFRDVAAGSQVIVQFQYTIAVNQVHFDLGDCQGSLPDQYLDAEQYIQADALQIIALADELSVGQQTVCDQARAIYDYVSDSLNFSGYESVDLGALIALSQSGGDCTEFADLFIALSRAGGIPARFLEGVTYISDYTTNLGDIKHDWTEVYLPEAGWVPVDPTWGKTAGRRDAYFASMTPDHIVVTVGRNLTALRGYHYYYFEYWQTEEKPQFSHWETWRLVRVEE